MSAKHLIAQVVHLTLDCDSPVSTPPPRVPENITQVTGKVFAARIPKGMQSGKSAVMLQIDLDDGSTLLLECSLALLGSIPVAFHSRDDAEGRPSSR